MEGTTVKLAVLLVLLASASLLEARHKKSHHHHDDDEHEHEPASSPPVEPLAAEAAPPVEQPAEEVETPPTPDIFIPGPYPPGYVAPPPGFKPTPYQVHGCGWGPCVDSNDCDWPCTVCCWNNTCCYDAPPPY